MADTEIDSLENRYNSSLARRDVLKNNISTISAELSAHQRNLRKLMDEAIENGHDPDNLKEEIRKDIEVVSLKLDAFEADLEAGEKIVKPMVDNLRRG